MVIAQHIGNFFEIRTFCLFIRRRALGTFGAGIAVCLAPVNDIGEAFHGTVQPKRQQNAFFLDGMIMNNAMIVNAQAKTRICYDAASVVRFGSCKQSL